MIKRESVSSLMLCWPALKPRSLCGTKVPRAPGGRSGPFGFFCILVLSCLVACTPADPLEAAGGNQGLRRRMDRADALWQAGDSAAARSLLLPLVQGPLPQLRALRLLSRMARGEGNAHEALVWLDRADSAVLELCLLCMDRSRLVWELDGGPMALEDIGLSLKLLERVASGSDPTWEHLGALRDMARILESAYREGMGESLPGALDD